MEKKTKDYKKNYLRGALKCQYVCERWRKIDGNIRATNKGE